MLAFVYSSGYLNCKVKYENADRNWQVAHTNTAKPLTVYFSASFVPGQDINALNINLKS